MRYFFFTILNRQAIEDMWHRNEMDLRKHLTFLAAQSIDLYLCIDTTFNEPFVLCLYYNHCFIEHLCKYIWLRCV